MSCAMKVVGVALLLGVAVGVRGWGGARGDSVVVFNEVMYHPALADEAEGEWLELQNQLSVDVDVSRWRLAGAIGYVFPEGTMVPAGGYQVVAAMPGVVAGRTGLTNVLGPFSGRLGNGGETLELRNNNDRLMDRIRYRTDGEWPVAADGAGFSLARRRSGVDGAEGVNWRASEAAGGTPGSENFAVMPARYGTNVLIAAETTWRYANSGTAWVAGWSEPDHDDLAWAEGRALFAHTSAVLPIPVHTVLGDVQPTVLFRTGFDFGGDPTEAQLQLRLLVDDGAVVYLNGMEVGRVNLPEGVLTAGTLATVPVGDASWLADMDLAVAPLRRGSNVLAVAVYQAGGLPAYPTAVLAAGPVGSWRLEESGGSAADTASAAGLPQSGAQNGSYAGFLAGNLGQAGPGPQDEVGGVRLTGFGTGNRASRFGGNAEGGDDVVLVNDPGVFNFAGTRQFSLEAWVNANGSQEDGSPIVCKGTGGGGEQYCLDVVGGTYRFYVWTGGANNRAVVAHGGVGPNGTWQHVVATFDVPAGRMALYVNAAQVASALPPPTLMETTHAVSIGARQLNSGPYDLNLAGRIDEVAVYPRALSTSEIQAHFAAARGSGGGTGADTNDMAFALELSAVEPLASYGRRLDVVLNEVAGTDDGVFWVELMNRGSGTADVAGCLLHAVGTGGNRTWAFPAQTVASGGLATVDQGRLGWRADAGDRLLLLAPGGSNVLDAVVVRSWGQARAEDGIGAWCRSGSATPGVANDVRLDKDLVINELLFHPADGGPGWIELYHRGSNPVNLAGWRLAGDVGFVFPSNQVLAPGGYLVVAQNPAQLRAVEPEIATVGPFTGALPHRSGVVELLDAADNRVRAVRYFAGGRWPERAGGGGSSLELRNPWADASVAESWAASDESSGTVWQTYTWRGVAQPGQPGEPTLWHELALCLLDGPGEVLVDGISVVESPRTSPRQLLSNGSFAGGSAAHWRFLGTHRHSRVEPDPDNPGNSVLHLLATGPGEYQGNQIETTLLNNIAVVDGREYEISFRARWLGGGRRLNARLYFNRLARTVVFDTPGRCGTPGRVNSRFEANPGPTFASFGHAPVMPDAGQPVAVTAEVADPDGVSSVVLRYAVDGGEWQGVPMTLVTAESESGVLAKGWVPGQPASSRVQFYLEAKDGVGAKSWFPAAGPDSRALYAVQDGQGRTGGPRSFRVIMTAADASFLHTATNALSNDLLGATVVSGDRDVYYNVGVRLKGSFVGRNVARVGFHVRFSPDRPFQGVHEKVAVDRSQHTLTGGTGEILVKHLAGYCGGMPNMYDDLAWFIAPQPSYTSMAALRLAGFDEVYLDSQYANGGDGTMYEPEVLRWMVATVDGNPESPKQVGNEGSGTGYTPYDLQDYGDDPERYRWSFPLVDNRGTDDLSAPMAVGKLFSRTGAEFATNAPAVLDVEEWLRVLAFQELIGPGDAYYTGGTYHNYRLYRRPEDGRVLYLPWDWDSCFGNPPSAALVGIGNVTRLLGPADGYRRYLNHLYDIITSGFNRAYLGRWAGHYGAVSGQDFRGVLDYVDARAAYVLARLPVGTPFAVTNNGGADFPVTNGWLKLGGTAPIAVNRVEVNGRAYPLTWLSSTTWSATVPLMAGINPLEVRGFDGRGVSVTGAVDSVQVTNAGLPAFRPVAINEWMAANQGPGGFPEPEDDSFADWFELYNPNTNAIELSGMQLTDNLAQPSKWTIPGHVFISPLGFMLVWADGATNHNPAWGGTNIDLHAPFQLSNGGEAIALFAPGGMTLLSGVSFGRQTPNVSEGRYPDGETNTVYSMARWTPRAPNEVVPLPVPRFIEVKAAELGLTLVWETVPGRVYRVEHAEDLAVPVWTTLGLPQRATGARASANDVPIDGEGRRFYRVALVP